jgi:DNA-binding winged helix-turn-helix (wHTH) protein
VIARFRSFTFDSARRFVTGPNGEVLHLTPKAFDLLTLLIEQAPHVVTKVEIHARLWPAVFVTDTTLVGLVKELRRALCDDDRSSPLIRTVHRVGYAFRAVEIATPPERFVTEHWINDGQRRIPLHEGENIIGRDPKSDVWLDMAGVSRKHARVEICDGRAEIEDQGSKNGTTIGDKRLTAPRVLHDGDTVLIGPARVTYRVSASGMSTETTPTSPDRSDRRK